MKTSTIVLLVAVIVCIILYGSANQSNYSTPARSCYLPLEIGPCRAIRIRYGYNLQEKICTSFVYGGCRGNSNNFRTLEECQKVCDKQIYLDLE